MRTSAVVLGWMLLAIPAQVHAIDAAGSMYSQANSPPQMICRWDITIYFGANVSHVVRLWRPGNNSVPVAQDVQDYVWREAGTYSVTVSALLDTDGPWTCDVWVALPDYGEVFQNSVQLNWVWPIPTGEITQSGGWWTGDTTIHNWIQTLTGGSFEGRFVKEQDPGGGGPDTCWFPDSAIAPATSITGGRWEVGSVNQWGPDQVGWHSNAALYYRNQGRAPCETQFYQRMVIERPGNTDVEYVTNLLRMGMTAISVWSERAGQYAERIWP